MSATHENNKQKSVSLRIDEGDLEAFTRSLREAQAEGLVPVDMSRSEAMRRALRAVADDPSLLVEDEDGDDKGGE